MQKEEPGMLLRLDAEKARGTLDGLNSSPLSQIFDREFILLCRDFFSS